MAIMLFLTFFYSFFFLNPSYSQTCLSNPSELSWTLTGTNTYSASISIEACSFNLSPTNIASFTTRCWNGNIPGPTIRMERGNIYKLTVVNNLGPENANNDNLELNEARHPNHTNVHTHGLHISGEDNGDYIFREIAPGTSHEYEYHLQCDHAGGTFWYHPHLHGSTAIQAGGGAAGILIVEDDASMENLPSWLTQMNEILLQIYHIDLNALNVLYPGGPGNTADDLFDFNDNGGTLDDEFILINGQYQPTICLDSDTWYRLRISYTSINSVLQMEIDGCDLELIAKDGVLIHGTDNSVPREVDGLFFTTASRADIAIYCPSINGNTPSIYAIEDNTNTILAFIEVTGINTVPTNPTTVLTSFNPTRPDYLTDLRTYNGPFHQFNGNNQLQIGVTPTSIFGTTFVSETNYLWEIDVNEVVQYQVTGGQGTGGSHPFHMHVNHFQIINFNNGGFPQPTNWFVSGDFHDVIQTNALIRFRAHTYGGNVIIHCHILRHEDEGAMGSFLINGGCDASFNHYDTDNSCVIPVCDTPSPTVNTNTPTNVPTNITPSPSDVTLSPVTAPSLATLSPTTLSPTTLQPTDSLSPTTGTVSCCHGRDPVDEALCQTATTGQECGDIVGQGGKGGKAPRLCVFSCP